MHVSFMQTCLGLARTNVRAPPALPINQILLGHFVLNLEGHFNPPDSPRRKHRPDDYRYYVRYGDDGDYHERED